MPAAKIISIHSYRGGTGKSNLTANLAAYAAMQGRRVAVLDTDLQSPGIHVLFGLDVSKITVTLTDFLWNKCSIEDTAYDVTQRVLPGAPGKLWLVPASLNLNAISKIIDEGYDVKRLNAHFDELIRRLQLDCLFIDTHPGLSKETMLTTAISDTLVLLIRPDQQDYQGTAVVLEIATKLDLTNLFLVANKIYSHIDLAQFQRRLEEAFQREVIGCVPLSEDLARLESRQLIVRELPDHAVTHVIRRIGDRILAV